jgi:predicted CopG family antitoxin
MPNKTIYIKDNELWQRFSKCCKLNGESGSSVIESLLAEYVQRTDIAEDKRARELAKILKAAGKYDDVESMKLARDIMVRRPWEK